MAALAGMMTVQRAGRQPSADADRTALVFLVASRTLPDFPTSGITAGGQAGPPPSGRPRACRWTIRKQCGGQLETKLWRSYASATHDSMVDKQNHDRADDRHKHAVDIEPGDSFSPKLGK